MKKVLLLILAVFLLGGAVMAVFQYPPEHIESVTLVNGKMEIVKSQEILSPYTTSDNVILLSTSGSILNKRVWKEIYIAKGGQIVLEKIIEGKIIPAQDEHWEFSE
jgi:hypothetical protein